MEYWPIIKICDSTWIKSSKLKEENRSHFCYNADLAFDQTEKLRDSKKLSEIFFINLKGIFLPPSLYPWGMRPEAGREKQ